MCCLIEATPGAPAGASRIAERARATIAGEFGVPPATVECLCAPDVRGRTAADGYAVLAPRQGAAAE